MEGSGAYSVNSYIKPGLPNITGVSSGVSGLSTGAFSRISDVYGFATNNDHALSNEAFDASKSNPIYGASDTVQPASYVVYFIIRLK